jgi:hypothetical protein
MFAAIRCVASRVSAFAVRPSSVAITPRIISVGKTVGAAVSGSTKYWSEWQDLNLRPPRPERGARP